ncbi:hypothetical protein THAOC_02437, partial [Thalassiosira oceanica]
MPKFARSWLVQVEVSWVEINKRVRRFSRDAALCLEDLLAAALRTPPPPAFFADDNDGDVIGDDEVNVPRGTSEPSLRGSRATRRVAVRGSGRKSEGRRDVPRPPAHPPAPLQSSTIPTILKVVKVESNQGRMRASGGPSTGRGFEERRGRRMRLSRPLRRAGLLTLLLLTLPTQSSTSASQ